MKRARFGTVCPLVVVAVPLLVLGALTTSAQSQQPGEQLTTTARVNLRADSTYDSPVRGVLPKGTTVTALGPHSDATGYARVKAAAHEGWVAVEYLRSATDTSVAMLAPAAAACGTACGLERWRVKTLSDDDASQVNSAPVDATVEELRQLPAPATKPPTARAADAERTTYRVKGQLIGWKLEDDRDFHLVLASATSSSKTMIVEVPDGACRFACSSPSRQDFSTARQAVIDALGQPSKQYRTLDPARKVTVVGVGFFDFLHHQTGVAPNGIELHPVLSIDFGP
jgi:hypothetical protein